jgi:ectoine hydroxylase-related dioxygenase (phytanoyl-CoA dioxygenase family)
MVARGASLRPVTQDEIDTFWRDGFVCLRQVIAPEWIGRMQLAVDRWLGSPECIDYTEFGASVAQQAGAEVMLDAGERRGCFFSGLDHWKASPDFADFAQRSPLPGLVAALLKSARLNLYEDSVLVKEPGAIEKTAFHQDMSYFHVEGHQVCTTWVPLDPVRAETGALRFIPGSHLWKKKYRPNFFTSELLMPDTEGEAVPDFHKSERSREAVSFDMEPGDVTVHHARTIHGAGGNTSASTRRRAISVRYCGDDARFHLRKGVPPKHHHAQMREGELLDHDDCPAVWPVDGFVSLGNPDGSMMLR